MCEQYSDDVSLKQRQCRGFTLIELVLVVVLLGILGATGVSMLYDPFATAQIVNTTNTDAAKARYALERVARELREVKWVSTPQPGAYCITLPTSPNSVTFRKPDGTTDCNNPAPITIAKNGKLLQMQVGAATAVTLADNVTDFGLTFKDVGDIDTTSPGSLVSIVITLTVVDTVKSGTATSENASVQRTRVFLRNAS